jgi:hypothetical protein
LFPWRFDDLSHELPCIIAYTSEGLSALSP